MSEAAANLIEPKEPERIIDWATKRLMIPDGPLVGNTKIPIRWTPDAFPLQRTIVEAFDDPRWAKVVTMLTPQTGGKTVIATAAIEHAIHHRQVNPMYIAANADLANTQWKEKIRKSIEASDDLRPLIYANESEGGNRLQRDFTNGTCLYVAGSESVGNLSGKTSPVVICDDVQAWGTLPKFGHPADYAATRTGSYPLDEVTLVYIGTAGNIEDWLYVALSASAFYLPFVPCLGCETYQLIEFDRFIFDPDSVESAGRETYMRCADPDCDHRIDFSELAEMLSRHVWVSTPPGEDWVTRPMDGGTRVDLKKADIYPETARNTNVAGFWSNAFYWPFGRTWGDWAVEWIGRNAATDSIERMKDWGQNVGGRPYKEPEVDEEKIDEAEIAEHMKGTGYPLGTVPQGADVVNCTVDVQSGYIYFIVRAWQRSTGNSWLVDLGTVGKPIAGKSEIANDQRRKILLNNALDQLDSKCRSGWDVVAPGGEVVGHRDIDFGAIDIGYEPDIVGSWWRAKHRGKWVLIKGAQAGTKASMWPLSLSKNKRGLPFREIDVNQAKHAIRSLQRIASGSPGYQALPDSGMHANTARAYARHMASERFNRSLKIPRWETVKPGARNHFWDCEVYQVCLAIGCRIKLPAMNVPDAPPPQIEDDRRNDGEHRSRSSWTIGR